MEIMEGLRGHLSGLGIPTYVVDSPHGGGKIPVMPNYVLTASDDAVVLRNYEGMIVRYQAEDKQNTTATTASRGVSALLQGSQSVLMPSNSERMARRQLTVLNTIAPNPEEETKHPTTNGHTNGCCGNGNGHIPQENLISLGVLANGCGS
jgi:lysine 2,3-aminomutase